MGFDTRVLLFDGTVKKIQNISVGDVLLGEEKVPCTVISTTIGKDALFKISYKDGHFVCNSQHVLCIKNDIKILENPTEGIAYVVSYFCPVSNRTRASICDSLRTALLKKNFLEEILGVFDISLNDYLFSKCGLPMSKRTTAVSHWESNGKSLEECYAIGKSLNIESINEAKLGTTEERKKILDGILHATNGVFLSYKLEKSALFLQGSLGSRSSLPFTASYLQYGNYYGLKLSGNKRFVLEDFIVTHNGTVVIS